MKQTLKNVLSLLLLCKIIDIQAGPSIGAVYTMTNGVPMNQILIQCIDINGTLTFNGSVNTNGAGVSTTNPNALFSQGPLVVYPPSSSISFLFAVNPGSNTLSMFYIDKRYITKLTLRAVQPTYGQFPVSVAVNSKHACVLTGGAMCGIRCFTYGIGGLNVISSDRNLTSYISQTTPPSGPANTMSDIIFSPDNLLLIVAVKGVDSTTPGYLLFFLYSIIVGIISQIPIQVTPFGAAQPFSLTLVGNIGLLIPDPQSSGVMTLSYSSTLETISNSLFTPIDLNVSPAPSWSTYSPTIGNYYVTDPIGTMTEFNIDPTTNAARIVQSYLVSSITGTTHATVCTIQDADFLYILSDTGFTMYGYRLGVTPGHPTLINSIVLQQGDTSNLPQPTGIAAYIIPQYIHKSASALLANTTATPM